jgi:hypothetical protein
MWRIMPLFFLRKMSLSKGRAVSNNSIKDPPEAQHSGPMSDQQLAVAIRQFQRSKNDNPLALRSTYRVRKQDR